ncbi:MAG: class I SAM-dependent methyltransferase [Thermodesulfobacteriota bacterium]
MRVCVSNRSAGQGRMREAVKSYFDRRARSETGPDAPGGDETGLIVRLVNERVRGRVLEIGCGMAPSIQGWDKGRWVALDISLGSLKRAPGAPARVCGDAASMPFRAEAFDAVVSVHMFHHVVARSPEGCRVQLQRTLREAAQVLVPDGVLVVVDTTIPEWLYPLERLFFPLVRYLAGLLEAPPVLFRSMGALQGAMAETGFGVHEARTFSVPGKALTPWESSFRWPMWLSPLRDAILVAKKAALPPETLSDP